MSETRAFRIVQVRAEDREIRRTSFVLDGEKEGCDQIVFTLKEGDDLKALLMRFFEGQDVFDFEIKEHLGGGRCEIAAVRKAI